MLTRLSSCERSIPAPNSVFSDTHLQAFDAVVRQLKLRAWLCGGTVRDLLLGRPFHDVDVVLADRVYEAAGVFRAKMNAASFVLDPDRHVARVVFNGGNWDITGFRDTTIEGDLEKRDFTINALAIRWEDFYPARSLDAVVDPFGGVSDLRAQQIRAVTAQSLIEDPLRMLRAFRIHAELGFTIDLAVLQQIEKVHSEISDVAGERVRDELDRVFQQPDSAATWRALGNTRLFDSLFPEMSPMKGCEQGGYHHLDVWEHSLAALENLENLYASLQAEFPDHAASLTEYLNAVPGTMPRRRLLKWAVLLHDIGKPKTRELREPGRWRFHGHDHAGTDLADALLSRLKFSRKDTQIVVSIIEHHLRPLQFFNQPAQTDESLFKLFRATGSESLGVLLCSMSDVASARGPLSNAARDTQFALSIQKMLDYYHSEFYPTISLPELLKGRDLMAFLQMKPGPLMGELLKEIREAQLIGQLRTRDDALDFARNWLKNKD